MNCKCAFIVYKSAMGDTELDDFITKIGIEPGETEERLFYGLSKTKVTEDFQLSIFVYESLSFIIHKAKLLKDLKDMYHTFYELQIKFSYDEDESYYFSDFNLSDEILDFIKITDTYYNLDTGIK
jgi:hypothetical protein